MVKTCLAEEGLDLGYDPGEDEVHEKEVKAEENHGEDDHQRGAVHFAPPGPGDLLDLRPDILQEVDETLIPSEFFFHGFSLSASDLSRIA
jgi:hypothetical protein